MDNMRQPFISTESIKGRRPTMSKILDQVYNNFLSERPIPKARNNPKIMIIFEKGNKKEPRQIYTQSCKSNY